jgi:hypothetical protein
MFINSTSYGVVTNGQTITPTGSAPWTINIYAYNTTNNLLASGYYEFNSAISNANFSNPAQTTFNYINPGNAGYNNQVIPYWYPTNNISPVIAVSGWSFAAAPSGTTQHLISQTAIGSVTQTIYFQARLYTVSFYAATRPTLYSTLHQFNVTIGNTTYYTSSYTGSGSNGTWTQYSFTFTPATAGYQILAFNFTYSGGADSAIGITGIAIA